MEFQQALGIVRLMVSGGIPREAAIENTAIPEHYRRQIREILEQEENIILEPPRMLVADSQKEDWLIRLDRSTWHYWPTLRTYLLGPKNWTIASVRSLDETTDRILGQLSDPTEGQFDIRGLVVGYVQSGKTANFTALIAKAADVGYRLVVVLSGIDNGLRRQTQIRLNRELVGYPDNRINAVPLPPKGKQWHQFTTEEFNGDFQPGFANYAALQGTEPVLLVIKKNGRVLRRLHAWLDAAPEDVRRTLPVLVIDDEADLASIDTRGSYQEENEPIPDDYEYEEPSVINGLIRDLLRKFQRRAYIAYTATPFANILIPHGNYDPQVAYDLYPKDFIIDLPKPDGYFGAEEQFGRFDIETGDKVGGLDIIRNVSLSELDDLENYGTFPPSLETAMLDFVLGCAARSQREANDFPATMLLHGSHLIIKQIEMANLVSQRFSELKDEWRYQRSQGIAERLKQRWENEFRPITSAYFPDRNVPFSAIVDHIGRVFESVQVRVINSRTGEVLDYEREPNLKAIAVGGNRLSRGLTLEGLLTSYFFRPTAMYDTLMQMGRWFGFKTGYEDLTRLYMTSGIAGWFSDLALVEHELRQDISVYEAQNVTPLELGTRILKHPAMLVTSRLKQRYARSIIVEQSYSNQLIQTIRFPFQRLDDLSNLLETNLNATKRLLSGLEEPTWEAAGPVWRSVSPDLILDFLNNYYVDRDVGIISIPLIIEYIQRQNALGELLHWTIAVKGRQSLEPILGEIELGIKKPIPMIGRNRLAGTDSLGVITNPDDEQTGLNEEQLEMAREIEQSSDKKIGTNPAARMVRPPTEGLLLIYPVSRFSGYERPPRQSRRPIYDNPDDPRCKNLICLAISFPKSEKDQGIKGEYVIGTVDWRPL